MANVLTRAGGRKRILVSTLKFVVRMQRLFLLMTKILCVAGGRVPLDD